MYQFFLLCVTKLLNKNEELRKNIERNEKEYSIQNDFNEKSEEIKQLLMDQQIKKEQQLFVEHNNNSSQIDLNSSMQHISKIMNVHKLMKEEEFEELLNTKKQLLSELEIINNKYNKLERKYKSETQKLLSLKNEFKHNKNQLTNINIENTTLKKEINNNKQLNNIQLMEQITDIYSIH